MPYEGDGGEEERPPQHRRGVEVVADFKQRRECEEGTCCDSRSEM